MIWGVVFAPRDSFYSLGKCNTGGLVRPRAHVEVVVCLHDQYVLLATTRKVLDIPFMMSYASFGSRILGFLARTRIGVALAEKR